MENMEFEKMGIYDLRNYARSIGVPSPTTLKRKELIENINAIIEGVQKPEKPKDLRGRPPKHKVDDMYMIDMFVPKNMFVVDENDFDYKPYGVSKPLFNMVFSSSNTLTLSESEAPLNSAEPFAGYFVKETENYGIIESKGYLTNYYKENVIILKDKMESIGLRDGDYVEGVCKYIPNKNIMLATEVYGINNKKVAEIESRPVFENIVAEYPTKKFDLSKGNRYIDAKIVNKVCPISFGGRVAVIGNKLPDFVDFAANLIYSIQQNGARVLLLSVDDSIEDFYAVQNACPEVDVCKYYSSTTRQQYFQKVDLLFKNLTRRLECGEDVVLVLYNTKNFMDNIKNQMILEKQFSTEKAEVFAKNYVKDIFGLARATKNGSLTVVGLNAEDDEILEVINCKIYLNEKAYSNSDIFVDVFKSKTKNVQKMLSEKEFEKLKSFEREVTEQNILEQLEKLFEEK